MVKALKEQRKERHYLCLGKLIKDTSIEEATDEKDPEE